MTLPGPVVRASCVRRSKRFVVTADTSFGRVNAFLAHTGRLQELVYPGARIALTRPPRPGYRPNPYEVLAAWQGNVEVVVDTRLPNKLIHRALNLGVMDRLPSYSAVRPEVQLGGSRIDFALIGKSGTTYLEVKSCSLAKNGVSLFPDAPSKRGNRHLEALANAVKAGDQGILLFLATRSDVHSFRPNGVVDPIFARSLGEASHQGVGVRAYSSFVRGARYCLGKELEVCLGPPDSPPINPSA